MLDMFGNLAQDDRLVNEYHIYFAKMIPNDQSAQCNFEVSPASWVGVDVCCDRQGNCWLVRDHVSLVC